MNAEKLTDIPGIGKEIARRLAGLGVYAPADLKSKNPEDLYQADTAKNGAVDRCVLYTYRCAVYYLNTPAPEGEKCKWWNWKDE